MNYEEIIRAKTKIEKKYEGTKEPELIIALNLIDFLLEKVNELEDKTLQINKIETRLRELINYSLKNYKKYKVERWLTTRDDYLSILNYINELNGNEYEIITEINPEYKCF